MSAGIYNITVEQRADFSRTLAWTDNNGDPIDLTGYTATCKAKDKRGATVIDFAVDGVLTVDGDAGTVTMALPGSFTGTLDFDSADYDLFLTGPSGTGPTGAGASDKLIKGVITLDAATTS